MTYPAYNQSSINLAPNGAITMSGISRVMPIKVARNLKDALNFLVKGHEVSVSFSNEPNKEIVSQLRGILLGDTNPPTYKVAAKSKPKAVQPRNIDMSNFREHIPMNISDEEVAA